MAYSERLASRVREALAHLPSVEEKKMFRGMTFMVNGKMCVNVSGEDLMVRIDPREHEAAIKRNGARTLNMKGRDYKGFIYVSGDGMKEKREYESLMAIAREFNLHAIAYRQR